MKKAIVLLSGGLDSATILYEARQQGFQIYCLIFEYGQKHIKEIVRAKQLAELVGVPFQCIKFSLPWLGSSLIDKSMDIPQCKTFDGKSIPSTYVPARNIIFLSFAASYAEAVGAQAIFIGSNAVDYSGYPDCRPEFFDAYKSVMKKGLKVGVETKGLRIVTPLLRKTKAQIIRRGFKLGVPYELTWSCYQGKRKPCRVCDSCVLRAKGFSDAGLEDKGV